ncbi:arylsulfatase [Verrucomicrobiaceae bacterium 5K15]|uniref:Arylsulfatase n=1 Tax=Oceaniferula flava TaxID=2800421 RepID=A0AAE2SDW1_9BACT|nr:arylsulfatase [Oceaniferula flavus]MBK1855182.1 arylsulfatase [Oceaniferula flavus]MBM1136488.1 arylsulfatase [Oceaniferula flavus]
MKKLTVHLLACFCTAASSLVAAAERPNIVLILADDLGYGDLGCYGAKMIQTPNIDQLAADGRRFTDAHSASAVCSPSRYGLMTGRYPHRKNFWGPCLNNTELTIETDRETISSLLKKAGYQTAFFGKWHLGFGEKAPNWNGDLKPGPLEVGFDYFYGIPCANSVPPFVYVENHRVVGLDAKDPIKAGGKNYVKTMEGKGAGRIGGGKVAHDLYVDDQIGTNLTQRSVKWLQQTDQKKPFFLMLSTTNIHHPFTPDQQFVGTSKAGAYGDFTHELDWMTGQIMKALEKQGVADNTLVIFTSDNGGMLNQEGQRAVQKGHPINGDLLGSKFGAWEGGHRIPMIVRWPGKVPAGTTSDALISHIDWLATLADIVDRPLENPEDSLNQLTTLISSPESPVRETLVICPNSPYHLSIRKGDWVYIPQRGEGGFQTQKMGAHNVGGPISVKLMQKQNSDIVNGKIRRDAPYEQLYHLAKDPSQRHNVIKSHPEVASELAAMLQQEQAKIPKTKRIGWINIRKAPKKK